jgi:hypothetical protein
MVWGKPAEVIRATYTTMDIPVGKQSNISSNSNSNSNANSDKNSEGKRKGKGQGEGKGKRKEKRKRKGKGTGEVHTALLSVCGYNGLVRHFHYLPDIINLFLYW